MRGRWIDFALVLFAFVALPVAMVADVEKARHNPTACEWRRDSIFGTGELISVRHCRGYVSWIEMETREGWNINE